VEYQVVVTPQARRDLENIRRYIARDNPLAAVSFCVDMVQTAVDLKTFPRAWYVDSQVGGGQNDRPQALPDLL
jgi:plasmid stabilization system protein ParE